MHLRLILTCLGSVKVPSTSNKQIVDVSREAITATVVSFYNQGLYDLCSLKHAATDYILKAFQIRQITNARK